MLGKVECFKLRPACPCQTRAAGRIVLFNGSGPNPVLPKAPDRRLF